MDKVEKLAHEYLRHLGFERIVFEPDGNVPPDFLVHRQIAVEARRLNQNEPIGAGFRGLEEISIPLLMKIQKLLISLGPPKFGTSWFVHYSFQRPLPPLKQLLYKLQRWLAAFQEHQHDRQPTSITVDNVLEIELFPASTPHPTFFLLGACSDHDSGGFVLSEIERNLRICIEEKTHKITGFRHRYPEWWLVLVDLIGYGLDHQDREYLKEHVKIKHNWHKIILLNPFDPRSALDIT